MAIDMDGNGIGYDRTENGVAWYRVALSNETMFWATVNEHDHALPILLWPVSLDTEEIIVTRYSARMALHSYGEGENVEVKEHIDGISVAEFVVPRLGFIIAALYAPMEIRVALRKTFNF